MKETIIQRIEALNWQQHTASLNEKGYALLPPILTAEECQQLATGYMDESLYRSIIKMEKYQFGRGEYKYFNYPLPASVAELRQSVYPYLTETANQWMKQLNTGLDFPGQLDELLQRFHLAGQTRPTPLILKYGAGDWNALHQDLYGELYFPFQMVVCLTQAGEDYKGGEFVMVENRPRMQSKSVVLQPDRGGAVIFTTNFRPAAGARGYYRVTMRHGVSEVRWGQRINMGIIFHDAK